MSETTTIATPAAATKTPKALNVCYCGCGGLTKGKFCPGHDAKFHGTVKKVLRGELNAEEELAKLPHDEARAAFLAYADEITPAENARKTEKERKVAEKAAAKTKKKEETVVAPVEAVKEEEKVEVAAEVAPVEAEAVVTETLSA